MLNKRLLLDEALEKITLVDIDSNKVSPATDIEDAINGKICKRVLQTLKPRWPQLSFIDDDDAEEICSILALNLTRENSKALKEFYNIDNHKYIAARKYVELLEGNESIPEWITEIKNYFA